MFILNSDVFRAGAEAIANLRPCPMEGRITADEIKIALVEHLDIVPACVVDDVAGDENNTKLPADGEEAEFQEDGGTPTPEPEFISEEEDENPPGAIPGLIPAPLKK